MQRAEPRDGELSRPLWPARRVKQLVSKQVFRQALHALLKAELATAGAVIGVEEPPAFQGLSAGLVRPVRPFLRPESITGRSYRMRV